MALYSYIPRRRAVAVSVLCTVALGFTGMNLAGGSQIRRASAVSVAEAGSVASIVPGINKAPGSATSPRFETTVFALQEDDLALPAVDAVVSLVDSGPDPVVTGPTPMTVPWIDHASSATVAQVGAVYGLAHGEGNPDATLPAAREPRSFYGAYLKSQTRFGPLGPGGIYLRSGATVSPYVTIPNAGGDASPLGGLHAAHGTDTVTAVGKASLGDLELDPNEHFLYVTNLFDGRVYQVDTWTNAVVGALPAAPTSCHDASDSRPFGLLAKGDTLYLGTVCSAQTSHDVAQLGADVWAFNTVTKTWAASPVMHAVPTPVASAKPGEPTATLGGFTPWSDDVSGTVSLNRAPMLTSIDIADDGSMVLGIRSRVGDMATATATGKQINGSGAVTRVPANGDGTWMSFMTSDPGLANIGVNPTPAAQYVSHNFDGGSGAQGAVVSVPMLHDGNPGSEIATTHRDLFSWNAQGVLWFDNHGDQPATVTAREEANRHGGFAKASSLGDLEIMAAWRSFGDRVWLDANGDGVQDPAEGGIAGVTLHLKATCNAETLASVTTDADGHFTFFTPPFVAYAITVDAANYHPGGALYERTVVSAAGGSRADAHGCMTVAKAGRGDTDHSYDMGFRPAPKSTFAVGDRVWLDANGNGRADDGEVGVKDITVQAFNADGPVGAPVHTNAEGLYVIGSLPAGDYHLRFSGLPEGYTFTTALANGVPAEVNSDAGANGVTATFTLKPGLPPLTDGHHARLGPCTGDMIDVTIDAGIKAPEEFLHRYAVGDRVWLDANHNGRQDDAETSVADVGVALFLDGGQEPLATTTTNADGFYIFDNLPKATYVVKFTAPAGYRFTTQTAPGLANTVDSDPNADGVTASFLLDEDDDAPNMTKGLPAGFVGSYINNTVDAGLYVPLAIGDFVWSDTNGNGVQDTAEPGAPGVRVALTTAAGGPAHDAGGAEVAAVVTAADGRYHFDNLLAGSYVVTFSNLPAGSIFSPARAGSSATKNDLKADGVSTATDSDPDPATGAASVVLPASGGSLELVTAADGALVATFIDRTVDAGLTSGAYSIGNRVWFDENDNGTFQAGEPGLANITVGVYPVAADGSTPAVAAATQVTDVDGYYRFDGLPAGRFVVKVEASNFAAAGHLVGFMSSKVDEVSPDADIDQNDNGVGVGTGPSAVASGVITLGPGDSEPLNENATDLSVSGQGARDARANMTVDFGFSATIDLGVEKTVLTPELGEGSTIRWRIKVSNNSNVAVVGAMVTDSIPTSVRPGSVSGPGWGCTFAGRDLTCIHDAAIPASSDSSFEVTGEVLIQNGSITNGAHVSNPRGPDAFPGNDDDEVTAIVITKVLPHTGSGIWRPIAIVADLLATLGAVLVIHDTYARRRRALGLV